MRKKATLYVLAQPVSDCYFMRFPEKKIGLAKSNQPPDLSVK